MVNFFQIFTYILLVFYPTIFSHLFVQYMLMFHLVKVLRQMSDHCVRVNQARKKVRTTRLYISLVKSKYGKKIPFSVSQLYPISQPIGSPVHLQNLPGHALGGKAWPRRNARWFGLWSCRRGPRCCGGRFGGAWLPAARPPMPGLSALPAARGCRW
jgi:hypothetical protein